MIEILEFVFAGFWRFVGTAVLLAIIFDGVGRFGGLLVKRVKEGSK